MKKTVGFTFTLNGIKRTMSIRDCVITQSGKIAKKYEDTLLTIENGKKIYGYIKPITRTNSLNEFELYPKEFNKAITLLTTLGIATTLIDEEPKKKTKGKFIIVDLSPEQEDEINKLKSLCK